MYPKITGSHKPRRTDYSSAFKGVHLRGHVREIQADVKAGRLIFFQISMKYFH